MRLCPLTETRLGIEPAAIDAAFAPFALGWPKASHPAWRLFMAAQRIALVVAYAARNALIRFPALQRTPGFVARYYGRRHRRVDYRKYNLAAARGRPRQWEWRERKIVGRNLGGTRVRLLLLMHLIERLRPASVLEVGCGDAINLFLLACRFPDIEFAGIDLSQQRHEAARSLQQLPRLPRELIDFAPLPLVDTAAFRRVDLYRGSAAELPFPADRFDLVLTVVAMEQMERIRDRAQGEIVRVARDRVAMIEPFVEVNDRGSARHYVGARDYFRGRIEDLPAFGLDIEFATADFLQKSFLRNALVLARKRK